MTLSSEEKALRSKRFYQFQIPVFIVSIIAGIIIAEHFLAPVELTIIKEELVRWGVICSLMALLYAHVVLILSRIRTITRKGISFKHKWRAIVLLAVTLFFVIIALTDPRLTANPLFTLLFANTVALSYYGMALGHHILFTWAAIKKLQRIINVDTLIMLITFTVTVAAEGMTMMPALWHPIGDLGVWIKTVPNMIGQRSAVAAAGIGAIILGLRALIGKEPGIIEVEVK